MKNDIELTKKDIVFRKKVRRKSEIEVLFRPKTYFKICTMLLIVGCIYHVSVAIPEYKFNLARMLGTVVLALMTFSFVYGIFMIFKNGATLRELTEKGQASRKRD